MQTIIILNTIGLLVLFAICTIFFIMLLNAYKHIKVLESKKLDAEQRAEYHAEQLKARAGLDDGKGFELGEKGVKRQNER